MVPFILKKNRNTVSALLVMCATLFFWIAGEPFLLPEKGQGRAAEVLIVGIPEYSPPEYMSPDVASSKGFALEFMDNVAEDAGYAMVLRRYPDWQTVLNELEQGHIHVVPLITATEAHKKIAQLTAPVVSSSVGMFIRSSSDGLRGLEDMQGRKVAVVEGDLGYAIAREMRGILIREAGNAEQLLVMLLSKQVDAIIYSTAAIQYMVEEAGLQSRITALDNSLLRVDLAVAVTQGRDDIYKRLDEQIAKFKASRAFSALYEKWYTHAVGGSGNFITPTISLVIAGGAFCILLGLVLLKWRKEAFSPDGVRALLEGMGNPVLFVSPEEVVTAYNSHAASLLHIDEANTPGLHFADLFADDDKVRKRAALRRVIETGESIESLHESGERLFRVSMIPVMFSAKAPHFVSVMMRDVTDRNKLERLLQETNRNFELIFEKSPEGIAFLQNNMTFSSVNASLARFLGYQKDELIGKPLRDVMYSEDAEETRMSLHKVFAGEANCVQMEKRFLHRNGFPVWASFAVSVQRSEQGVISGIYAHVLDIHERKISEQRLRESEQRYREIFERASDLILLVNLSNGRIEEFNQAVVVALGYSVSELSSMSIDELDYQVPVGMVGLHQGVTYGETSRKNSSNVSESVRNHLYGTTLGRGADPEQGMAQGQAGELFDSRLRKKDGSYLDVQVHTKVLSASGRQYALSVLRDISGRKEAEYNLLRAENVAESAIRARDDFFANISSEFRTPMQGLLGMMQLIGQTSLDGVQREYIRLAQETGNGLMRFFDALVDFADLERGEKPDDPFSSRNKLGPFVVDDMLTMLINGFSSEAALKGARLSVVIDSEFPEMIVGEAARIHRILFNLVGYTLQFARNGHVRISLRQPREGGRECENGLRMTEFVVSLDSDILEVWHENVRHVFEVDGRGDFENYRTLGLVMSKRLAVLLQGSIYVDSGSGEMEIVLRVPLRWTPQQRDSAVMRTLVAEVVNMEEENRTAMLTEGATRTASDVGPGVAVRRSREGGEHSLLAGIRVIVADDDSINRMVVGRWLEIHGGVVTYAEDGSEVLRILESGMYDCVVMDLQMPVMGGLEAAAAIRSGRIGGTTADIPILAFTAFAMPENRDACRNAGMNQFFSKPIDLSELSLSILSLVRSDSLQDAPGVMVDLGAGDLARRPN